MKVYCKIVAAAALAALSANAVVVRKMPEVTVIENETISTDAMKATAVRSSNPAVFGAALRETGEAVISGLRLGSAVLSYVDERGVFASRPVMVVARRRVVRVFMVGWLGGSVVGMVQSSARAERPAQTERKVSQVKGSPRWAATEVAFWRYLTYIPVPLRLSISRIASRVSPVGAGSL